MSEKQDRREFLLRTGCAALSAAAFSAGLKKFGLVTASAMEAALTDYRALVCIFLEGGNDQNNMIIPMDAGYTAYAASRNASGLALGQSGLLAVTPSSLGVRFGLHPNLPELHTLWGQQKLAVACNVGSLVVPLGGITGYQNHSLPKPLQLFSHSDQVSEWQTSRPDTRSQTGWGGRAADKVVSLNGGAAFPVITSVTGKSVFSLGLTTRPLGISAGTPLNQVLVLNGFTASGVDVARKNSMDFLRTIDRTASLVAAAGDTMTQAIQIGADLQADPVLTTVFPTTSLGSQLLQVAKVMKLNQTAPSLGLNRQIFFCSLGGFDTHQDQVTSQAGLFTTLSQAMNAFYNATVELQIAGRVTTFTMSDFGRTLEPSGSGIGTVGSDHAWGSHQFVMGGAVVGGNFYGIPGANGSILPNLTLGPNPDSTDDRGRWIPSVSIDQYAATLANWFGVPPADMPYVFPLLGNFSPANLGFLMPAS